ncbi:hypothetical protein ACAG26_21170 [Mycobacterium sp. pUA109]|uniref:hypothetical protein n=1 Tax=Mycobacterium sp. pUA109 TaxID=3238982 RepID=UPI00351B7029
MELDSAMRRLVDPRLDRGDNPTALAHWLVRVTGSEDQAADVVRAVEEYAHTRLG